MLATVTVTVKLSPEDVAWLDGEVARRRGESRDVFMRGARPTRSLVVRALVERARKAAR